MKIYGFYVSDIDGHTIYFRSLTEARKEAKRLANIEPIEEIEITEYTIRKLDKTTAVNMLNRTGWATEQREVETIRPKVRP